MEERQAEGLGNGTDADMVGWPAVPDIVAGVLAAGCGDALRRGPRSQIRKGLAATRARVRERAYFKVTWSPRSCGGEPCAVERLNEGVRSVRVVR